MVDELGVTAMQVARLQSLLADLSELVNEVERINKKTRERIARSDEVLEIARRHG